MAQAVVLADGVAWRMAGWRGSGRRLARTVARGGDDERTLAGMLLVQAGERSIGPVIEEIEAGNESEELVTVLASIGGHRAVSELSRLAGRPGPLAVAAARALEEL